MKLEMLIVEARDPKLTYTTKGTKTKVDRVIVALEGSDSASLSRLAKRFSRLDKSLKAMAEAREAMHKRLHETVSGMFDPEEKVLTRVAETVSFSITVAKEVDKVTEESEKRDFEKIANELAKLIPAELQAKVDEITKMYTTVVPGSTKAGMKKVTVDSLNEGVLSTIRQIVGAIGAAIKRFTTWGKSYDDKLGGLKSQLTDAKKKHKAAK